MSLTWEYLHAEETELRAADLRRDELGRLRDGEGRYVCEASGRVHLNYLRPLPTIDRDTGAAGVVWVDEEAVREILTAAAKAAGRTAGDAAVRYVLRALEDLAGTLLKKGIARILAGLHLL